MPMKSRAKSEKPSGTGAVPTDAGTPDAAQGAPVAKAPGSSELRLTHNQQAVLIALEASDTPRGAYEILDAVRKDGLRAPLQVYRALEKLIGEGLVHRIESLNAFVACEHGPHSDPAGFIICKTCSKAVEVSICECAGHLTASARAAGFKVDSVRVEMTGLCADCHASISAPGSN